MKLSLLSTSLLIFAFATAEAEPLGPPEVKALLDRVRAKRAGAPQVQADFQEEKTVHLMNKAGARRVRILERGAWFVSSEHDDAVIDATLAAAREAAQDLAAS